MEGVDQLLSPVLRLLNSHHLEKYLSTCREHLAFYGQNKNSETHITLVNQLLSDNSDRYGGLTVLRVILEQCSVACYTQNAPSWLTNCVKATNDKNSNVVIIAFNVLGKLLGMAVKIPEINKMASTNVVPQFLEHTKRPINSQTISSLLECLTVCMKYFAAPCGQYRKHITGLLTKLVDSESTLLSQASKCFALLAQIKCTNNLGVSYSSYWKENQQILINTLHFYMDKLFMNVTEIQVYHKNEKGSKKLLDDYQVKSKSVLLPIQVIEKRIKGICFYLQSMLLGSFPVPKQILPDALLGVICRGLAVTCSSLGPMTNDSIALGSVLPDIHVHLLRLMMALITTCKRNMIPYGSVICKLIAQDLKWTASSDWPYAIDKPYRNMRTVLYKCLRCWLLVGRSAASLETVLKEIISSILIDVKTEKHKVTLKVSKGGESSNTTQLHSDSSSELRSEKLASDLANEELCLEALKCLQLILYSYSRKLEAETCEMVQECILVLLYAIQNEHEPPPVPYRSIRCRRELYNNLITLCLEPHNEFPPPITFATTLLNRGINDPASEVSVLCMAGLSSIEKIIHPSGPPLPGAMQYQHINSILMQNLESGKGQNICASINDIPLSVFPNISNITLIKLVPSDKGSCDNSVHTDPENLSLADSIELVTNGVGNRSIDDNSRVSIDADIEDENEEEGEEHMKSAFENVDEPTSYNSEGLACEKKICTLLQPQVSESYDTDLKDDPDSNLVMDLGETAKSIEAHDGQPPENTEPVLLTDFDENSSSEQLKGVKRPIENNVEKNYAELNDHVLKKPKTLPSVNGINDGSDKEHHIQSSADSCKKVNGLNNLDEKSTDQLEGSVQDEEDMMNCFVDIVN